MKRIDFLANMKNIKMYSYTMTRQEIILLDGRELSIEEFVTDKENNIIFDGINPEDFGKYRVLIKIYDFDKNIFLGEMSKEFFADKFDHIMFNDKWLIEECSDLKY